MQYYGFHSKINREAYVCILYYIFSECFFTARNEERELAEWWERGGDVFKSLMENPRNFLSLHLRPSQK
jgi:hypothetical protein